MIRAILTGALLCLISSCATMPALAKQRLHPDCNVTMPCEVVKPFKAEVRGPLQPQMFTRKKERQARAVPQSWDGIGAMTVSPQRIVGLVPELASKVSQIVSTCGSKVVSGVRHTNIAGTRKRSLHSTGQAADLQGNPSCIYAMLQGWAGGYSTDYHSAPGGAHVHISWGGFEHGRRFAHQHYGKKRYAKRHRHRGTYAAAGQR